MDDSFQGPYEIAGSKGFQNEPVRVDVAHRFQKALTSMHGKNKKADITFFDADLPGHVEPAHSRHTDVKRRRVAHYLPNSLYRTCSVRGLATIVHSGLLFKRDLIPTRTISWSSATKILADIGQRAPFAVRFAHFAALNGQFDATLNHGMMQFERNWLNPAGIPGRPWFKHPLRRALHTKRWKI